jgi:hypothetical protein
VDRISSKPNPYKLAGPDLGPRSNHTLPQETPLSADTHTTLTPGQMNTTLSDLIKAALAAAGSNRESVRTVTGGLGTGIQVENELVPQIKAALTWNPDTPTRRYAPPVPAPEPPAPPRAAGADEAPAATPTPPAAGVAPTTRTLLDASAAAHAVSTPDTQPAAQAPTQAPAQEPAATTPSVTGTPRRTRRTKE